MDNYKCPKCIGIGKPQFKESFTDLKHCRQMLRFFCAECNEFFEVIDKGFGYLRTRSKLLKEKYP